MDTSLLLCGVLTARQFYQDAEIQDLATRIYNRVDWPWMLNKGYAFSMGWTPENGFLRSRWDHYGEMMMIYLLGIGSPTNPISPETWKAFTHQRCATAFSLAARAAAMAASRPASPFS